MTPAFSVIVCSIDDAKFARVTASYRHAFAGAQHEIIGIRDARSLAEGYNRGIARAHGQILVFSHDDIEIASPDLPGALRRAAESLDVFGVVGTSRVLGAYWPAAGHPHLHGWLAQPERERPGFCVGVFGVDGALSAGLQGLDGVFFAATRPVVQELRFDAATFDGFHGYDMDFTFAAHLAGLRVGTTAEIAVIHASGGNFGEAWQRYAQRFAAKYRDDLPPAAATRPWSFARQRVESREAITRDFPLERLIEMTRQLRATRPATAT